MMTKRNNPIQMFSNEEVPERLRQAEQLQRRTVIEKRRAYRDENSLRQTEMQ